MLSSENSSIRENQTTWNEPSTVCNWNQDLNGKILYISYMYSDKSKKRLSKIVHTGRREVVNIFENKYGNTDLKPITSRSSLK